VILGSSSFLVIKNMTGFLSKYQDLVVVVMALIVFIGFLRFGHIVFSSVKQFIKEYFRKI